MGGYSNLSKPADNYKSRDKGNYSPGVLCEIDQKVCFSRSRDGNAVLTRN